jgi:hypothetical protein
VNGPADDGLNTFADRSQNSAAAATVLFRSPTAIAGARLTFAALITRTTIGRLARLNRHGARDVIASHASRDVQNTDQQFRCEDSSRNASMNGR